MADAQRIRYSKRLARMEGNMFSEIKTESLVSVKTGWTLSPGWNLAEETMLLTPDERS